MITGGCMTELALYKLSLQEFSEPQNFFKIKTSVIFWDSQSTHQALNTLGRDDAMIANCVTIDVHRTGSWNRPCTFWVDTISCWNPEAWPCRPPCEISRGKQIMDTDLETPLAGILHIGRISIKEGLVELINFQRTESCNLIMTNFRRIDLSMKLIRKEQNNVMFWPQE